jgi:hypothetical protein
MRSTFTAAALAAVLALSAPVGALAQAAVQAGPQATPACANGQDLLEVLSEQYREEMLWVGQRSDGSRMVLMAAVSGGSWTIVVLGTTGTGCIAAAGEPWFAPIPAALELR